PRVAVRIADEPGRILASLTSIRLASDAIHGDSQRLVSFFADRAKRHGASSKTLDDFCRRLHFFNRDRLRGLAQLHQAAQSSESVALLVDQIGVLLKSLEAAVPNRVLKLADGQRIE